MNILPTNAPPWNRSREGRQGLFDTVFDGVDEAILILEQSPDLPIPTILDVNKTFTRWTRIERQNIKGASFSEVLDIEGDNGVERMAELFSDLRSFDIESALVCERQPPIPVHMCVAPTIDMDGARRFTAVARRANEIERQAAELARRERDQALMAREKLFSRLSHDLRTPLNGILGFSEIMKEDLLGTLDDERYRIYARNIYVAGKQLLWKIEELLDLKSLEEGSWPAEERTFDLREATDLICDEVVGCSPGDDLHTVNYVPAGLPAVTADQKLFRKAVTSLVMTHLMSEWPCDRIYLTAGLTSRGDIALCIDMSSGEFSHRENGNGCPIPGGTNGGSAAIDEDEFSLARGLLTRLGARLDVHRFGQENWQFILTMPAYRIG